MRRIHLFEIEDFSWFPGSWRDCMTQMLLVVHRIVRTSDDLVPLVERALRQSGQRRIIDLCSGSGGPMLEVVNRLRQKEGLADLRLELTDLYPVKRAAQSGDPLTEFHTLPVCATNVPADLIGLRTMICSFHHMRPAAARQILQNAQASAQPICIHEISDNTIPPPWLFWAGLPLNFLFALYVSLMVRPMTLRQVLFTWLIPILPICFAWDGAVSNVRTYGIDDMQQLLDGLDSENYHWETGVIHAKPSNKVYLLGLPKPRST